MRARAQRAEGRGQSKAASVVLVLLSFPLHYDPTNEAFGLREAHGTLSTVLDAPIMLPTPSVLPFLSMSCAHLNLDNIRIADIADRKSRRRISHCLILGAYSSASGRLGKNSEDHHHH